MISIEIIGNPDGTVTIKDERIFSAVVENQIYWFKKFAMDEILSTCPEFKQRNAAMGLLSQQEIDDIKNKVQAIRDKCNELEQKVLNVQWDGTEETRAIACDAVQSVCW